MSNNIFREKSVNKVASPEQLNDYIRVPNPSVWIVLISTIVFLVGVCIWGIYGRLDTVVYLGAVTKAGHTVLLIPEDKIQEIEEGMTVLIENQKATITSIPSLPIPVSQLDAYEKHASLLEDGEWVYPAECDAQRKDGIGTGKLVLDSVSPMSFVMN